MYTISLAWSHAMAAVGSIKEKQEEEKITYWGKDSERVVKCKNLLIFILRTTLFLKIIFSKSKSCCTAIVKLISI